MKTEPWGRQTRTIINITDTDIGKKNMVIWANSLKKGAM
jgi:hypothetical protein